MPDGMIRPMLPAVEKFVAHMRKLYEDGMPEDERWQTCRVLLADLIADPDVKAHAQDWPVTGFNPKTDKVSNLLFYEDPDYGFVINALIKNPGGYAMIHDHGPSWTKAPRKKPRPPTQRSTTQTHVSAHRVLEEYRRQAKPPKRGA